MRSALSRGPVLAFLLTVVLRLALLPLLPIPVPGIHDEFSYLLGADTFASGRLTNPPHPMWIHFETFHINFEPTYHTKYPPAQSLVLAFGQRFLGHPWFAVVLSMGAMFAAICWALEGWIARRWAMLTIAFAILTWGITSYWMNSYWGGALAALAGALVIGAVPRLVKEVNARTVVTAASGVALLMNTRPFEGALTVLACAIVLIWWKGGVRPLLTARAMLAFAAVLVPTIAAMAWYNYRLTGSPTLLPYVINERTYAATPRFYLAPPMPTPVYRHEVIRKLWDEWDRSFYDRSRVNPLTGSLFAADQAGPGYTLLALLMALAGVIFSRRREKRFVLAVIGLTLAGALLEKTILPHYLASIVAAWLLLAAFAFEAGGSKWAAASIGLALGLFALEIGQGAAAAAATPAGIAVRPQIAARLQRAGGKHLVLVRYSDSRAPHEEWVYNAADIDASLIVWARDMGVQNRELLDYYPDRKVWLIEPDRPPVEPRELAAP